MKLNDLPRFYAMAGGLPLAANKPADRWYNMAIANKDTPQAAIEIEIYNEIGSWGYRAADFLRDLRALDDGKLQVVVAINSPGGDVFDGIAISNALNRLGERCTARIDGWAASSASIIAVGAHKVVIAANASMMIHNPWTIAAGDASELRAVADSLDVCRAGLVATYRRKSSAIGEDELVELLDAETWLTPGEAVALGLADEIGAASNVKACVMPRVMASYRNTPKWAKETSPEPEPAPTPPPAPTPEPTPSPAPTPAPEDTPTSEAIAALKTRINAACTTAGAAAAVDAVLLRMAMRDEAAIHIEVNRITAIGELCAIAKRPAEALAHIRAGADIETARTALLALLVKESGPDIDNTLPPGLDDPAPTEKPKAKTINYDTIYSSRKGTK